MIQKKSLILMIFESSKKYCKLLTPIQIMSAKRKKSDLVRYFLENETTTEKTIP